MKVVIVGPAHPLRGGISDTNESWARAINELGHVCEIFSFSLQYPSFLFPGKTQFRDDQEKSDLDIHSCINSINPWSWYQTAKKINYLNPDIIYYRYWIPFIGISQSSIAKRINQNIKQVALCDNLIPHEKRPGDTTITKKFISHMDGFITMSEKVKREISSYTNKKILQLNHPINKDIGAKVGKADALRFLHLNPNKHYILFFGLVRKYKGLDILIDAYAELAVNNKDVDLIIAGEFYEDFDSFEAQIQNHSLSERIHIHNKFIPKQEIKYFFSAADLVAQTYRTASQSGISPMCMHFELPMLVTNVGGLPEMVIHNKTGFISKVSKDEISHYLIKYFDEKLKAKFSSNILEEKEKYSWTSFTKRALQFAEEL